MSHPVRSVNIYFYISHNIFSGMLQNFCSPARVNVNTLHVVHVDLSPRHLAGSVNRTISGA